MSTLLDTDLFVVDRDGTQYQCTTAALKANLSSQVPIQPLPGQVTGQPAFQGGSGTQSDPYIITPVVDAFIGGTVFSEQVITIGDQAPNASVSITDDSIAENGSRFTQPSIQTNSSGQAALQLRFIDAPASAEDSNFIGLLRLGDECYFQWSVTLGNNGITRPTCTAIQSSEGEWMTPPVEPNYFRPNGKVISVYTDTVVTGLENRNAYFDVTIPYNSGAASGRTLWVTASTPNQAISGLNVVETSDDWEHNEEITIDISDATTGGPSDLKATVSIEPTILSTLKCENSPFIGVNAGDYASTEYQFSLTENFDDSNIQTSTNPVVADSIKTEIPANKDFYYRFRYTSDTGVQSPWSPIYQATMGSVSYVSYVLNQYRGGPSKATSGKFPIPKGGSIITATAHVGECSGGGGPGGVYSYNPGQADGLPGDNIQIMLTHQIRDHLFFVVESITQVDEKEGVINTYRQLGNPRGMQDQFNTTAFELDGKTMQHGPSNVKLTLTKDADFATIGTINKDTSEYYSVGDFIVFQDTAGNGKAGSFDSDNDYHIHAIAGSGGAGSRGVGGGTGGGGGGASFYGQGTVAGEGRPDSSGGQIGHTGTPSGSLYPKDGAGGNGGAANTPQQGGGSGGGGGGGWGNGGGGAAGRNITPQGGGGGGAGCSVFAADLVGEFEEGTGSGDRAITLFVDDLIAFSGNPTDTLYKVNIK